MRHGFRARSAGRYGKRPAKGEMTRAETAYAELLFARKLAGEIIDFRFQEESFVLAEGCRYHPDFGVLHLDGRKEFVDVKGAGPIADDALVKIKCAAEKFFEYLFVMEQQKPKKFGGGWKRREF